MQEGIGAAGDPPGEGRTFRLPIGGKGAFAYCATLPHPPSRAHLPEGIACLTDDRSSQCTALQTLICCKLTYGCR